MAEERKLSVFQLAVSDPKVKDALNVMEEEVVQSLCGATDWDENAYELVRTLRILRAFKRRGTLPANPLNRTTPQRIGV